VTPEAADHLQRARTCLERARVILEAEVPDVAAREAYLAAFHAAQALVVERTRKEAKTHKGAHTEFARLTRGESRLDPELRQFLPKSYDMKSLADYGVGPHADISDERAGAAIETAERFVECIAGLLAT
jgi:uncharacterized protein (UPF0332 family)